MNSPGAGGQGKDLTVNILLDPETISRFWALVDDSDGPESCWLWKGIRTHNYGVFDLNSGQRVYAHRLAMVLRHGEIGDAVVLHGCDNPPCVNAFRHLSLGTQLDNIRDMQEKARASYGITSGEKHHNSKLTEALVVEIRRAYAAGEGSHRELGKRFGIHRTAIYAVVTWKTWAHVEATDHLRAACTARGSERFDQFSKAKLSVEQVEEIRRAYAAGTSGTTLARKYSVANTTIYSLLNGHSWKAKGPP